MLAWLVSTSLRFRVLVLGAAAALVILGGREAAKAPLDVFPEFAPPTVEVQTEAPGLSTEEVEALVSMPLENALTGIPDVTTLRSKSVLGLSSVVLLFEPGTDVFRARQLVHERISTAAARLPAVARPPVILQPLSATSRALKIGITSATRDQMALTDLARWTIRPKLMAIPGVANVAIWGERDRQLQVLVDPDRLRAHGVTLEEVERAAADAVAPAPGGFVDTPNQRLALRQLTSHASPAELGAVVVASRGGATTTLGEVAEVVEGHPPPIGDAVIDDGPGLLLIVEKHPWGNTLEVTRKVEEALDALRPGLGDLKIDSRIFRPATFIERSIHNLGRALILGCALVIVVLVLFLADWRTAATSAIAIPLSLLAAGLVLRWMGGTLDTMVLAGLIIATGEVVDDAIIDVENIARRLRQNRASPAPRNAFRVVLEASVEVRSAVVVASLVVVLVFVPVFFLPGLSGAFFRPLALAYVLAIAASLLVALTVTPALCYLLLARAGRTRGEPALLRVLVRGYRAVLPRLVERPGLVMLVLILSFAGSGWAVSRLGEEFLPEFQETDFLMHWVEKPGTSLEAMRRITIQASRELRSIPGVLNFGSHIGRAEVADEVVGPNFTELWISVDEAADYRATVARVQEVVDGHPGLYRDLLTYLKERIKEVLSGASASVVVRLYGPELGRLREQAQDVAKSMASIDGVADLKVEAQILVPHIVVDVDLEAAGQAGVAPGRARSAVATLVQGRKVGEIFQGDRVVDVVVRGAPALASDLAALRAIPLENAVGAPVPLASIARVAITPTPNEIKRERASRRLDITCNVRGRDLGGVSRDVASKLHSVAFAPGYHAEVLGEAAEREAAWRRLFWLCGASVLAILLVLHADFLSLRTALIVFASLPFALIGGVIGAWLGGRVVSLGTLVGFVTVLGIAARNGIMLVSHWRHLEQHENEPFGRALILRGAAERLGPILMTALCAALGLLPLVLGGSVPGHEIEYPMALVILGGLATSTLLNLFFLPSIYARFGRPVHRGEEAASGAAGSGV